MLHNALYGPRLAPLHLLKKLCDYLIEKGNFRQLRFDNLVFVEGVDRATVIVLAYVDNLVFFLSRSAVLEASIYELLD